jgi:GNAT superfamily N-acetyltransferase
MAGKPLVRVVKPDDLEEIIRLCAEHALFEKTKFTPEGKANSLRRGLFATVPRLWCFVVESGSSVVGYATCTKDYSTWRAADYLHLDCLYLDQAYRNLGIGTEMMRMVAQHAEALECATLEWQTPAWNANAARFYQKLGATCSEKMRFRWDRCEFIP